MGAPNFSQEDVIRKGGVEGFDNQDLLKLIEHFRKFHLLLSYRPDEFEKYLDLKII